MSNRSIRSLVTLAAAGVLALGGGVPAAMARHGADDPVSHDAGDDHGGQRAGGHGADDPAGHDARDDKGGKRKAARRANKHRRAHRARHGAHHRAGDDKGGRDRGRGNDDGPNHT